MPDIRLLEVKSGGWGFSDIFKVKGWMVWLQLKEGEFIVQEEKKFLSFFIENAKKLGIDVICIPDLKQTAEALKPLTTLEKCTGYEIQLWRFSYWIERLLLKRLYASKKAEHNVVKRYGALAEYFHLVNNKTFFTENIVVRVEELYQTFQKFSNISAKCASESLGMSFDAEYEVMPKEVYSETYYECRLNDMAISCFVEHRACLAILKNAVDYIIYRDAGNETKTTATSSINIFGVEHTWPRLEVLSQGLS